MERISNVVGLASIGVVVLYTARLMSHAFDRKRIEAHLAKRGGRLLSSHVAPSLLTWLPGYGTLFAIRYRDAAGDVRTARAHVLMLRGVYLTGVALAPSARSTHELEPLRTGPPASAA